MSEAPAAEEQTASEPGADKGPLLLIDGHSLAYRAFFALPDSIATADGSPTNALYGLASMLVKIFSEQRFSAGICCWDAGGKVFRHEEFPEYKAGRAETPDLFREQSPEFRPLMEAFGLANTELPGYEADDVIGTLARQAEAAGRDVVILTGDRDALQLVSDQVSVLATGRGVTDTVLYTPEAVQERYGVSPELMTDFRGMVGDSSDNLPGVPGIGEKGAAQLIQKYGDLESVLAAADEQSPKRRENLIAAADDARMTRDLATIVRDAPVEIEVDEAGALDFDPERLAAIAEAFRRLEFMSLVRRLDDLGEVGEAAGVAAEAIAFTVEQAAPESLGPRLAGGGRVALAMTDERWALAVSESEVLAGELGIGAEDALRSALGACRLIAHDAKGMGMGMLPLAHDTMIAAYLLRPRRRGYPLDELCEEQGIAVAGDEEAAARAAVLTRALSERQAEALSAGGLDELFSDVELPLVHVLAAMEEAGVKLDVPRLGEIAARVRDSIDELRDQIYAHAGEEFSIESPKQMGHVLFEKLGLPTFRKGKTGYSTDRQVLKRLADKHPIIELIGSYRELTKLDSTYLSALPALVDRNDRLHTTFGQTVAETGRLSSRDPNLQNIPVRTPLGREIRGAFIAERGAVLVSCDYSQVELRILAHCSGEPALKDAFAAGADIHRATASEVFGVPPEEVDRDLRDRAKAVNFGIIYGISDFGLSEQLDIPRADAKLYIETYLDRYPRVREFMEGTIAAATQDGYVTTLLGRRRPIPELAGRTVQQRHLGERLAVNTVVQGSAADIIKVAMMRAHDALRDSPLGARLVLQIHDELLLEAPEAEASAAADIVRGAMVGAYPLDPALSVDVGIGETWLDAKS
jgi:DNA polymerase-1